MKRNSNRTVAVAVAGALTVFTSFSAGAATSHHHATKVSASAPLAGTLSPALDSHPVLNTSRMVTYTWTPNRSFVVRALGGIDTDIEVPAGEKIEGFYLSNATDWSFHVTGDHRRVLIKPVEAGLYNTALLVTDKHSYQLTLASVQPDEVWYQRVTWTMPDATHDATGAYWTPGDAPGQGGPSTSPSGIDPSKLYFNYDVRGKAAFRPLTVFDDGARTWMRFSPRNQDLPAIFAITDDKTDVVNYTVHDGYVVIPRVAAEFVLRLDGDEIKIERGCDPARCLR